MSAYSPRCTTGLRNFCQLPKARLHLFRPFSQAKPCRGTARKSVCALVAERKTGVPDLRIWARDNKLDCGPCELSSGQHRDALTVSTGAQTSQALITVPQSLWITTENVKRSAIGPAVSQLESWLQLALYILHCRTVRDSPDSGYLLSLPTSLDVPVLWTDQELALLEGTQIASTVEGYRCHKPISLQFATVSNSAYAHANHTFCIGAFLRKHGMT